MRIIHLFGLIASVLAMAFTTAHAQTLEQTLAEAYAYAPELRASFLDTQIARESEVIARSERRLQITSGANALAQSRSTDRVFGIDDGETVLLQGVIDASLPLYTGGRLSALIEQAQAQTSASDFRFRGSEQRILLNAVIVHMDVLLASEVVRIRERNADRLKRQSAASEKRFEAGTVTRTDVAASTAQFSGATAELARARARQEAAEARYLELTGTKPVALSEPQELASIVEPLADLIEIALRSNPAVQAALESEFAAGSAVRIAQSRRRPQVSIGATGTLQDGSWDNDFRDSELLAGVRATIPIYQGGALKAGERTAVLQREQARLETQRVRDGVVFEVVEARADAEAAQTAVLAARDEVAASETGLRAAQIELDVGLRTTLDLLDQEQELLEAELRLATANRDAVVARHRVLFSIGEMTPRRLGVNVKLDNPANYRIER